ncbi:DUF1365 domain-containing protein [uncultured Ramlibacter sp.]|uniref:DUF1365 domain-containing protein n=1 Tax=uncultured Ramlibacter sp. TaxID=260755 RepID=UPI002638C593|nr:DUF1365 family protein [uncultured Ramlibacter sp.]
MHSALYTGHVMHQRMRPLRHGLRYRVFSLLLDLDELPALCKRLRWLSLDRFNLFSIHQRDHGAGEAGGLRSHVERQLLAAGLPTGGAIRLLTMPRILGHAFNPLSVYFCHAVDGRLAALLYEVNNTFGDRHSYLIEVEEGASAGGGPILQRCAKRMHVSPFLGLEMDYRFRIRPPDGAQPIAIGVDVHDVAGAVLVARLDARHRPLGDGALLAAFFGHPLLTFKVVAAIHWEALRLWLKGVPLQARPPPPPDTVTVITKARTP